MVISCRSSPHGGFLAHHIFATGVGWTDVPTKAESQFDTDSVQIYAAAYKAAKAEMHATQQVQSISSEISIDMRV